jgi:DNA ligase 1
MLNILPWQVLQTLESDNSRLFKEQVIQEQAEAGNTEFFRGARACLDNMITFGVKKVPEKNGDGRGITPEMFWDVAHKLATRQLTGNAAQTQVNYLRLNATEAEWNGWYRRILIKDLRCGVSEKTINNVVGRQYPDYAIPVFSCQLAHDSSNHENKVAGTRLVEVKLDGVRVITIVYPDGRVDQFSRNGKELVNFEHIKQQLSKHARLFSEPMVLDGEVMSASFQDLMKQVHRKSDVSAGDAVLHLFDILTLTEFQSGRGQSSQLDRSYSLRVWYQPLADHMPNVRVLAQELVNLDTDDGRERFRMINNNAVDGGYEGIMIKDPEAVYECKRTTSWLKLKPYIEVSLTVTALEEGTGKNVGKLGALVCEGVDDGRKICVNVGSGFTDIDRDSFWTSRGSVVGNIVEVRADAVTQNQDGTYSLRFPRFKGFRGFQPGEKI